MDNVVDIETGTEPGFLKPSASRAADRAMDAGCSVFVTLLIGSAMNRNQTEAEFWSEILDPLSEADLREFLKREVKHGLWKLGLQPFDTGKAV